MQRTAIVTGAARRVGRQIAEALAADGWRVVSHVREAGDEVADGTLAVAADLSAPECATRIFEAVEAAGLPPVRLLVNSAALFERDSLEAPDAALFEAHMAVNARAPMLLIAGLAKRHDGGEALVVNVTDAKLAAPNPDYASYTLAKAALSGLTEMAARALAGQGIRVNAIAPALMLPSGPQDDAAFARVHRHNPLGHGVEVDELIAAIRFLVASPSISGQTLALDAGQRFWALPRDVQFLDPGETR